jgi:hypothetical protein
MWTRAELIQLILDRERKLDAPSPPKPFEYMEQLRQRNLADECAGKCVTMNTLLRSIPKPRPPRRPSWDRR